MTRAHIELPWPPSVNRYWRHPNSGPLAGRTLISAEGRAYRTEVEGLAVTQRWPKFGAEVRLSVHIAAFPPDRRRRDLDNVLKSTLDALTHAGLWGDDAQIDSLQIVRLSTGTGAMCITVEEMAEVPA